MNHTNNPASGLNAPNASVFLRPHNLKELSALYSISVRTFKKWLQPFEKQVGVRIGYLYTASQVKKIFELLGAPNVFYEEGGAGKVGGVISLLSILPTGW
jgi:hypothetical protein